MSDTKMPPQDYSERIITVGEYLSLLNEYVKPLNFSIIGEVSSVSDRAGNTVFFSVSDEKEQAKLECVIWRYQYQRLGFKLEPGMQIKMAGYPNIYKPSGKLSYVASNIIPTGEGALQKAFEELKKLLQKEGFFAPERKRALPKYIQKIGLITADNSDAKKDFETHLGQYGYTIYFHDVRVEGLKSAESIAKAIRYLNEIPLDLDVIVITRGGGSLESLQAFNSEIVARAVFSSKTPILSAIGHERDVTISDLVADVRGSTPTDAGKIISKDWREAEQLINTTQEKIFEIYGRTLNIQRDFLELSEERLRHAIEKHVTSAKNKLDKVEVSLETEFKRTLQKYKTKVEHLEEVFRLVDPREKLKQGYALIYDTNHKIIKSTAQLRPSDIITVQVHDGGLTAEVKEILKDDSR